MATDINLLQSLPYTEDSWKLVQEWLLRHSEKQPAGSGPTALRGGSPSKVYGLTALRGGPREDAYEPTALRGGLGEDDATSETEAECRLGDPLGKRKLPINDMGEDSAKRLKEGDPSNKLDFDPASLVRSREGTIGVHKPIQSYLEKR